ncbi:hypothetical protein Hanom_Chr12g01127641 [Helianthus anomalus]
MIVCKFSGVYMRLRKEELLINMCVCMYLESTEVKATIGNRNITTKLETRLTSWHCIILLFLQPICFKKLHRFLIYLIVIVTL